MKRSSAARLRLLLLLPLAALLAGCSSTRSDEERLSERPWNAPRGWETGLPTSMTEGR